MQICHEWPHPGYSENNGACKITSSMYSVLCTFFLVAVFFLPQQYFNSMCQLQVHHTSYIFLHTCQPQMPPSQCLNIQIPAKLPAKCANMECLNHRFPHPSPDYLPQPQMPPQNVCQETSAGCIFFS